MRLRATVLYDSNQSESEAAAREIARDAPSDFAVSVLGLGPCRDDLPAFFDAYEASDVLLVGSAEYHDRTGSLPGTVSLPLHAGCSSDPDLYDRLRAAARPTGVRPDFSNDLTVFVTTVGAPSYRACRELLRRQDCTFTLDVIDGIAPLSAALQQMLDRCRTPYYVQVDEDMLLYPYAVRTLYEGMSAAPPNVVMVAGQLYDVHLERCIQGVKIARHAIAREYPWTSEPNVIRRLEHLASDGYIVLELPATNAGSTGEAVGLHSTHATPDALYDRYLTLERLRRAFPSRLAWFEPYPAVFLQRFLASGRAADLQALTGVLAGAMAGPLPEGAEIRDARRQQQHDLVAVPVPAGVPDR